MMPRTPLSIILVCVSMPYVGPICVAAGVGPLEEMLVNTTVSFVLGTINGKVVLGTALEVEPKLFWHNAVMVHVSQVSCFGCLLKYPLGHNVQDVPVAPK